MAWLSHEDRTLARRLEQEGDVDPRLRCTQGNHFAIDAFKTHCCQRIICTSCALGWVLPCKLCGHHDRSSKVLEVDKEMRMSLRFYLLARKKDVDENIPSQKQPPRSAIVILPCTLAECRDVPSSLSCAGCSKLAIEAVQSVCCSNNLCLACQQSTTCPVCLSTTHSLGSAVPNELVRMNLKHLLRSRQPLSRKQSGGILEASKQRKRDWYETFDIQPPGELSVTCLTSRVASSIRPSLLPVTEGKTDASRAAFASITCGSRPVLKSRLTCLPEELRAHIVCYVSWL